MELVNITYSGEGLQPVELTPKDRQLVTANFINSSFGADGDYLELYIYDQSNQLLDVDYDAFDYYPFLLNNPKNDTYSALTLDPEKDLRNKGFNNGEYNVIYRFLRKELNNIKNNKKFIVAGLSSDFNMEPIGDIIKLVPLADEILKLSALCIYCKDSTSASFTKLIKKNDNNQILVGAGELYSPCCRTHFLI